MKNNEYTAIIKKDGNDYIGWIEEIPGINCQENSIENLKKTLKITLIEALAFNRQDAIALAGDGYTGDGYTGDGYKEEKIAISV